MILTEHQEALPTFILDVRLAGNYITSQKHRKH